MPETAAPPAPVLGAPAAGDVPSGAAANGPADGAGAPTAGAEHAALAGECAALAAALRAAAVGAAPGDAERARLKAEIVAVIRAAAARARAFAALEEDAKALAALWKALPPPPPQPPDAARRTTRSDHLGASTFRAKGWSAFAVGDHAGAEAAYAQALALAPDDAEAGALHAWTLSALGRDEDAVRAAEGVLAAAPPDAAAALARVALGRVCLRRNSHDEAVEHLSRVARDDADRRATLYATFHLGVAAGERGMHDDAVALLGRALALGPNLVEAHYELGRAHWRAGNTAAAYAAWRAGAAAGKFSPWAARCEGIRLRMEQGGELPAV
jgi:tetratricopeptide (TPR) repeat protein